MWYEKRFTYIKYGWKSILSPVNNMLMINSSPIGALLNGCLVLEARQSSEIAGRYPWKPCELQPPCTSTPIELMEYLPNLCQKGGWSENKKLQITTC